MRRGKIYHAANWTADAWFAAIVDSFRSGGGQQEVRSGRHGIADAQAMSEVTPDSILAAVRTAAKQAGGAISRAEFVRRSGIGEHHIYRLFPEGWTEVIQRAGLPRHPLDKDPLSDVALLEEFHRVAGELGEIPTWQQFDSHASISAATVRKRFRGLQGTLRAYHAWLAANHPESALMDAAGARMKTEPPRRGSQSRSALARHAWAKRGGTEFGRPLNFRALRHAPINEQGVVYLFGTVSYELGLIVEAIQTGFPDCEAKRCIDVHHDRWQRVRIEFEFRSRSFRDHGHDAGQCDLIVCWEHDWPECPLEVVELRTLIGQLHG